AGGAVGPGQAGGTRLGPLQPARDPAGAEADDRGRRAPLPVRRRRFRAHVPGPRLRAGPVTGRRGYLRPGLWASVLQSEPRAAVLRPRTAAGTRLRRAQGLAEPRHVLPAGQSETIAGRVDVVVAPAVGP